INNMTSDMTASEVAMSPELNKIAIKKASERNLQTTVCDRRTAYVDSRTCQAIPAKWFENYPGCRAMRMYMPRSEFADFLLYVPEGQDTVYVIPRGKISYDTNWSEPALEPYKEAWHLLKKMEPALFERKSEAVSKLPQRVIEEAERRGLPYELIT